ncbi:MAG: uroporphyrinogen-III synthase [Chloroflexi bacterium]|nr:uroporphyrinogen-III synthase [Chloroflexota bacterium]
MSNLSGRTIALLEARRSQEVEHLVRLQNGTPLVVPALREVPVADDEPLRRWLERLADRRFDLVIFLTGVGCQALLSCADRHGLSARAQDALANARVVARGPKPVKVLRDHGIRIDFVPPEPNTTDELLEAFADWELRGKCIGLQVYGGTTPFLERFRLGLAEMGVTVDEVAPYRWEGPAETTGVETLIAACTEGRVDALAILSSSQINNLFAIAEACNRSEELREALNSPRMVIAAVGPVAADAVRSQGVKVDLEPEHPKMGHLIMALGDVFAARGQPGQ